MWIADGWKDYEVIDASQGEKLERWGKYILVRPDPQVIWDTPKIDKGWKHRNAHYHRSSKGGGEWEFFDLPKQWNIGYKDLTFNLQPFSFKHTGLFPEQAANWEWFSKIIKEAKKKGLIREFGITSHNIDILEKVLDSGEFSTIQCPYNPVERKAEGLFKRAKGLNVGTIVMKPVAGGAIRNVNLSIRYIVGNPNVTVAIPGMDTIEQVLENSRIGNEFKPLTVEERTTILKEAEELGSEFCRRCGYCAPCPQGIDIPTQFLLEGYYTRYNLPEWAKERYAAIDKKADNCVECGQCEKKCPYNLPIRKMLKKVVKTLG